MELSHRAVTALFCSLGVILVAAFGLAALRNSDTHHTSLPSSDDTTSTKIQPRKISQETADAIALRSLELAKAKEQIERLQSETREQSRQLAELQSQLSDTQTQNRRLRTDQEQALAWLVSMLGDNPNSGTNSGAPSETSVVGDLTTEELAEWQRLLELEEMRARAVEAQDELNLLRAQYADALGRLQQQQQIEAAVGQALATVGSAAVPALTEALENPQPEVRRWAARSLRELGVQGQAALPALTLALADPEESVRAEVARAIQAIRD